MLINRSIKKEIATNSTSANQQITRAFPFHIAKFPHQLISTLLLLSFYIVKFSHQHISTLANQHIAYQHISLLRKIFYQKKIKKTEYRRFISFSNNEMKYNHSDFEGFTEDQFAANDDFRQWVLYPEIDKEEFWNNYSRQQ